MERVGENDGEGASEREKDRDDRNRSGRAPLWQWNRTLDDGHHRNRLSLLEI